MQGDVSEHLVATAMENFTRLGHELASMSTEILPVFPFAFFKMILQSGAGQRHSLYGSDMCLTEGS